MDWLASLEAGEGYLDEFIQAIKENSPLPQMPEIMRYDSTSAPSSFLVV